MDLRKTILAKHSKAQCNKIVKWVGRSQERFDELFDLFLNDQDLIKQRAAWPIGYIVISHPQLIQKHFGRLLKNLRKPKLHDSIKRNSVRLLQHIEIPERFHGDVMDICFNYVSSPTEAVAIKCFSLTVLKNLSEKYPDIKNEMRLIIEEHWYQETAAFRARAKKILQ